MVRKEAGEPKEGEPEVGKMENNRRYDLDSPRFLPSVHLRGVDYFVDERLRQFRQVTNPHNYIEFDTEKGRQMLGEFFLLNCSVCGQELGVPFTPTDWIVCIRCGERIEISRRNQRNKSSGL